MSLPQKSINIRLPNELAETMDRLAQAIPELGRAAIVRALLREALASKTLDQQVKAVTRQLLAPAHPICEQVRIVQPEIGRRPRESRTRGNG